MKKSGIIIIILVLIALVAGNAAFTVQENEYACTVRFSKLIDTTAEAGLHFKVPFVDSVSISPRPPSSTTSPLPRF